MEHGRSRFSTLDERTEEGLYACEEGLHAHDRLYRRTNTLDADDDERPRCADAVTVPVHAGTYDHKSDDVRTKGGRSPGPGKARTKHISNEVGDGPGETTFARAMAAAQLLPQT